MKKLMFIFLAIVFFNVSVFSLYYLKVISYYGFKIFDNNVDILITNLIYISSLIIYSYFYQRFIMNRFNYLKSAILGSMIGLIIALLLPDLKVEEFLYIILFSSFIITFISYSIYFDTIKEEVFK